MATVVGLFDTPSQAQQALQDLMNSGIGRDDMSISADDGKVSADTAHDGLLASFISAGVPEEHAHAYTEGIKRGGTLVSVHNADMTDQAVRGLLQRAGAGSVSIEVRGEEWRTATAGMRTELPDANTAPADAFDEAADAPTGTSIGALSGGMIPGGYGAAGGSLLGFDDNKKLPND